MVICSDKVLQAADIKAIFINKKKLFYEVIKANFISASVQVLIVDLGPHLWPLVSFFPLKRPE